MRCIAAEHRCVAFTFGVSGGVGGSERWTMVEVYLWSLESRVSGGIAGSERCGVDDGRGLPSGSGVLGGVAGSERCCVDDRYSNNKISFLGLLCFFGPPRSPSENL